MDSPAASPIAVPILTAPGVCLRPFHPKDASWVYYVSLDPEIRARLSLPDPYHRAHARHFVDEVAIAAARDGHGADFVIEDAETLTALGWIGFHRDERGSLSCGFWLAADARGRGIMTSALRVACRWALTPSPDGLGAETIHWEAQAGNHASRAVAEKVGFIIRPGTVRGAHGLKWSGQLLAATFAVDSENLADSAAGRQES